MLFGWYWCECYSDTRAGWQIGRRTNRVDCAIIDEHNRKLLSQHTAAAVVRRVCVRVPPTSDAIALQCIDFRVNLQQQISDSIVAAVQSEQ